MAARAAALRVQLLPHPDGEPHPPECIKVAASTSAESLKETVCTLLGCPQAPPLFEKDAADGVFVTVPYDGVYKAAVEQREDSALDNLILPSQLTQSHVMVCTAAALSVREGDQRAAAAAAGAAAASRSSCCSCSCSQRRVSSRGHQHRRSSARRQAAGQGSRSWHRMPSQNAAVPHDVPTGCDRAGATLPGR